MNSILCNTCCEVIVSGQTLPCGHHWCSSCLERVFSMARNELHYPPKCCEPIDFATVQQHLSNDLVNDFRERIAEYETLPQNRLYCAHTDCLKFIPSDPSRRQLSLDNTTLCFSCSSCQRTCLSCKQKGHSGACSFDTSADNLSWQKAISLGCQICPGCESVMIERSEACAHVRCPCGFHFCIYCCQEWYKCLGNCKQGALDAQRQDTVYSITTSRREGKQHNLKVDTMRRSAAAESHGLELNNPRFNIDDFDMTNIKLDQGLRSRFAAIRRTPAYSRHEAAADQLIADIRNKRQQVRDPDQRALYLRMMNVLEHQYFGGDRRGPFGSRIFKGSNRIVDTRPTYNRRINYWRQNTE